MSDVQEYKGREMQANGSRGGTDVKILAIGAGIGAVTGLAAAFLLNRRAAQKDSEVNITAGEGLRIGLLVLGLLRSIVSLGDEK
jgi:uncharacterized ion transporter superfamily protein YfcC